MPRRTVILALLISLALLATGCGGGDGSSSSSTTSSTPSSSSDDNAFIAKANVICKPAITYYQKNSFPYKNFNPQSTEPKELRGAAIYLRNSPLVSSLEKLQALTPPDDLADKWKRFVAGATTYADAARKQIQAGLTGDAKGFTGSGGQAASQLPELRTSALAVGFDKSSGSCETLFIG